MANSYLMVGYFVFYMIFFWLVFEEDKVTPVLQRRYDEIANHASWTDLISTSDPVPGGLLFRDVAPIRKFSWMRWDGPAWMSPARHKQ